MLLDDLSRHDIDVDCAHRRTLHCIATAIENSEDISVHVDCQRIGRMRQELGMGAPLRKGKRGDPLCAIESSYLPKSRAGNARSLGFRPNVDTFSSSVAQQQRTCAD